MRPFVESVGDAVAAVVFDDSGRDEPARRECAFVVVEGFFAGHVADAGVWPLVLKDCLLGSLDLGFDRVGRALGPAGQDIQRMNSDPILLRPCPTWSV